MAGEFDDLIPTATAEASVNPFSDLIPQSREQRRDTIRQQIEQTSIPAEEDERPLLERRATDALLAGKQLGNVLDAAAVQAARGREKQLTQAQEELRAFETQWPQWRTTPDPAGVLARRYETLAGAANAANAEFVRSRKYIEQAARGIIERAPDVAALAESQSAFQKRFNEAQGKEAWKLFLQRPGEVLAGTLTSSSVVSAPALGLGVVGGLGGPIGSAVGVAEGSFLVEFGNTVSQEIETELRKRGKKPDDMAAVTTLLADREFLDRSGAKAAARGVPIAIFDALTAGLAGKFLGPALGKGVRPVAAGAAKEAGLQMAGGALGEAAGQLAAGEKFNPKDILLEAVAELPGGVRETVQNVYNERATQNATTTRKADEVLDSGAAPARVPADGQDRADAPAQPVARPENSFSDLTPSPVAVVPVPEVAPGQVAPEPPKPQRVDVPGIGAVNIQNPAGSIRSGTDKGGNEWQITMPAHYGDIVGTKGKDKDRIDIYVGPNTQAPGQVAIVNQINPETGKFDEHKVLAGFTSLPEAVAAYDAAFSDGSGPSRRQSVVAFTPEQFQTWLTEGDHSKPAAQAPPVEEPSAPPVDVQRGEVGGMLASGQIVTTATGRQTTPFPKLGFDTERKTSATVKRVDAWLHANAIAEAESRGDEFNGSQFRAENPAKMPQASKDAMEQYLFGEQQPPVIRSPLKPISPPAATPAGAPPVVDVTANPSATRTPEAAAVEKPAWKESLKAEYDKRIKRGMSHDKAAKAAAEEVELYEADAPELFNSSAGTSVQTDALAKQIAEADFAKGRWQKPEQNSAYFKPGSDSLLKDSGSLWHDDGIVETGSVDARWLKDIATKDTEKVLATLGEDAGLKWLASVAKFEPPSRQLKPEIADELKSQGAPKLDPIESALNKAIEVTDFNPGQANEGVTGAPIWLTKAAANGALRVLRAAYKAGKSIAEALSEAVAWLKANGLSDANEAEARDWLTNQAPEAPAGSLGEPAASAEPAATERGVTEPAEGEQPPPVVDEHWVETKVKGVSWWVRDRDHLTPESTERSIDVAEAAFTEAGFESERRTMFDTGDHQTKSILFIPETERADAKGRKLAEVLEREIQTQREEGKGADHVSTLINSVREGFDQPESAFRQMSAQVRNRLFALAQEEASWRGRALRALANSKADIIRVSRNVDVYLQRIYSKAFAEEVPGTPAGAGDITDDLRAALREVLTDEEIDRLPELIADPANRERIKAALKKALAKVAPKGNRRFGRKNWRTIEALIEGGILDDTEWFKALARKRGWKVPTDAEIEQMRRLADEEQALRQPTDAELAKAGDDPLARDRLLADIEAATRESRFKLQKRLAVMWSEMTKPVSMRHYWTQRQNNARFLNELMTANLLFRASFVGKQAIDITTQWFWRMPMRAIAQAITLRHNDLSKGRQVQFWDDAQGALKDIYGDSIKSLKVAGSKARAALAGRVEIRNVDRLMGSVSALDRLWLRADRAVEAGNNAEAFMWRAVAAIGFSYKVAGAFDYLHGTPAEWNERRFRVIEALRETGVDAAAARVQADWVMNGALAEYPEAVAMTRSMLEARGIPFTEQYLRENAWNMVERRQYQRISELGLPVDSIQEQAEFYRQTLGWNEREMRGLGGVMGGVVSALGRGAERIGLPLALGRFGNAIAIGINRQLHRTPLYKLADIAFMSGSEQRPSAWSRTLTDIYERRLEAVAGTMVGSAVLALAMAGLVKVWLKPPPDKEERELWEREGHKAGTVEIPLGDGRYSVWSLTTGPFALVAPYLAAGGALNDMAVKREKAQARLDADAARRGLTPAKLPAPDISDWFGVAAQAAQGSILGNRTASGLFYSVTDYGTPNVKKFVASQFTPLVPGLPALQEVSRMSGVIIDPKKADVIDFLVPLPTSKARKYNMLGDPVGTPDDVQRVIQTLTGGTYPVIAPGAAREADAYQALFATGYRPPSIDPNAGRAIGGDLRPFTSSELERYTEARSRNLRQELRQLGPAASLKEAREAYQRANSSALREVGVTVAPPAETSASGRAARGTVPSRGVVGNIRTTETRSGTSGRSVRRTSRLSRRGLRGVRLGRQRLSRASRIRLQPRLGRGRRRGLSRGRRLSSARA